jgi:hypothetical protein
MPQVKHNFEAYLTFRESNDTLPQNPFTVYLTEGPEASKDEFEILRYEISKISGENVRKSSKISYR